MQKLLLFLPLLMIAGIVSSASPNPAGEVRELLERQQAAWNKHDLEGFMAGYWKSEELTFFSGGKETHGWQTTLDHYRKRYQGEGHEMGKLAFRNLRIEMLGQDAAFVRGEYWLTLSDGKTPHGIFTLIARRLPEGWRLVHDHSAEAE